MTTPLQNIKHVFVLVLENRSLDHLLGFSGITGKDAVNGTNTKITDNILPWASRYIQLSLRQRVDIQITS